MLFRSVSFDSLVTTRYFLPNEEKSLKSTMMIGRTYKKNVQKNINYGAKKVKKKKKKKKEKERRGHGHAIIIIIIIIKSYYILICKYCSTARY